MDNDGKKIGCVDCHWWDPYPADSNGVYGQCRYNPPIACPEDSGALWPIVTPFDWCRQFLIG